MKRIIALFLCLVLLISAVSGLAERKKINKGKDYIGAMRVVNCSEYVSLREAPDKTSKQIAQVPLDAIVLYCTRNEKEFAYSPYRKQVHQFTKCEYEGMEGYIISKYLKKAPEYEPVETQCSYEKMTREELTASSEIILDWKEFNVSVLGTWQSITDEAGNSWETVRVGCFIDDEPEWGYTESVQVVDDKNKLSAFMGGTEDEPQIYVYDAEYGMIMLDLMDGTEQWTVLKTTCNLGDAAVVNFGEDTGIMYVAGSEGPDPVAISAEGNILWKSSIDDPELGSPVAIRLNANDIEVDYDSGAVVSLEYNGELIGISEL